MSRGATELRAVPHAPPPGAVVTADRPSAPLAPLYYFAAPGHSFQVLSTSLIECRTMYLDPRDRGRGRKSPRVVWLSAAADCGAAAVRRFHERLGMGPLLKTCYMRFTIAATAPVVPLAGRVGALGMPPPWWKQSAKWYLVDDDPGHWRLCGRSVSSSEWLAVDELADLNGETTVWRPGPAFCRLS